MSDRTQSQQSREREAKEEIAVVAAQFDKQAEKYSGYLPSTVTVEEFRNAFLIAVQRNLRLLDADRGSLFLALQDCANSGLRPDGREAALVIFGDDDEEGRQSLANRKKQVVFQPMVWGLAKLVHNTGNIANIRGRCIYKGEHFRRWDQDGEEHYEYRPSDDPDFDDDPNHIIGAFAVITFKDGSFLFDYLSRRQIERRRAVSRARKGPWLTWPDEQTVKTVLKHLFKRAPKSREMQHVQYALDRDEGLPTIDGEATEISGLLETEFQGGKSVTPATTQRRAATTQTESEGVIDKSPPSGSAAGSSHPAPESKPAAGRKPPAVSQAAGVADVPTKAPPQAAGGREPPPSPPAVDYWPADENGEPVDDPDGEDVLALSTALGFAAWLANALSVSTNPEALWQHNADSIEQVKAEDEPAYKVATEAMKGAIERRQAEEQARAVKEKIEDEQVDVVFPGVVQGTTAEIVQVPTTNGGKPDWRAYEKACIASLGRCADDDAVTDWVNTNLETYSGRTIAINIDQHTKNRRVALRSLALELQPPQKQADGETWEGWDARMRREVMDHLQTTVEMTSWWSQHRTRHSQYKKIDLDRAKALELFLDDQFYTIPGAPKRPEASP